MAFSARASSPAIAAINITPLVDVLLVLLVIFMITAPVVTHKIRSDLPRPGDSFIERPEPIRVAIAGDGGLRWNDAPVTVAQLDAQLVLAGARTDHPSLMIDAADEASYQAVAHVLAQAKSQGLNSIDFIGR
ncbi:MAG TPA: biopolymer transporter ExbD [Dyella sp.]|uniref:ExbD/TolR family protein n=1 Tax=Dyella sp. TaxID=1869338 RepID=UPI002F946B64